MIKSLIQIFLLSLIGWMHAGAQTIHLKASVNRDRILIGEPILLQLELETPKNISHGWFRTDSLEHFEIIESGKIDTASAVGGDYYKQVMTITSFDSGSWTIPMLSLVVNDTRYLTDSIKIEVSYSPVDPNQPYHNIKEIIEVPEAEPLYINYIIAVATLVAIALLIWYFRQKKKPAPATEPIAVPRQNPFEKAMTSLQTLKASGIPDKSQVKSYFTQLNAVLRTYLQEKKILLSPDSNNAEMLTTIKPQLDQELSLQLSQALRLADAAKFAKYQPEERENETALQTVRQAIEKIENFDNKVLR